ncbi:MAG: hypothetical protein AAGA30_00170 [Planctomycetota bacterium]
MPTSQHKISQASWEEGRRPALPVNSVRPKKPYKMVAPIMRKVCNDRINALNEIAKLAGKRPEAWKKPKFGSFEYWLAHNVGWITDAQLNEDARAYESKRQLARETSQRFSEQRFSWLETPRYGEPDDSNDYVPQVAMKLIKDRNLTDSSRRIAQFVLRYAYQDNREGRFIGMTVSFIMKGLSLSRRTVQRSLTLLETRGYFRCEVAKAEQTRMCVGLIIHLQMTLLPKHHQMNWPERRGNSGASKLPHKQNQFYKTIYSAKQRLSRLNWAIKCMNSIARRSCTVLETAGGGRFKPIDVSFLSAFMKQNRSMSALT